MCTSRHARSTNVNNAHACANSARAANALLVHARGAGASAAMLAQHDTKWEKMSQVRQARSEARQPSSREPAAQAAVARQLQRPQAVQARAHGTRNRVIQVGTVQRQPS